MKYDMSREKVRDILYLAENTGIAPGPLLLNPDLVPIAKEIAEPELGLGDAAKNMVANYN
ncbi:MAG: hypothetical protein IJS39_02245 [Synergistaceae bacterium]|nr:hypothetical protein [Synergistaceae bacterium]